MNHLARTLIYFTRANINFTMLNEQFITGETRQEMLEALREFNTQVRAAAFDLTRLDDIKAGLKELETNPTVTVLQRFLTILNSLEYLDLVAARVEELSEKDMDLLEKLHDSSLECVTGTQEVLNSKGLKPVSPYNPLLGQAPVSGSVPPTN